MTQKLKPKQNSYLEKRRKLLKAWTYVGPFLLLAIIGFAGYLYLNIPWLINPYEVLSRLQAGSIPQSTIETMAIMLPVMILMVCILLLVVVVIMYAAFSNEKKYLRIVDEESRSR